ncbi:MAG: hypothetical protein NDF55_10505 [archaeon GB-1867-005]|nr:hypothetical protein [Candidatus Culexmicrobium cathedralense]
MKLRCPVCGRSNVEIIEGSLHYYAKCRFCGHMWDLGLKGKSILDRGEVRSGNGEKILCFKM